MISEKQEPVLFDSALTNAINITKEYDLGREITLIRDFRGRIRPILPTKPTDETDLQTLDSYRTALTNSLGAYGFTARQATLFLDDLGEADTLLAERRLLETSETVSIYLLDRQIIGQDWMRGKLTRTTSNPRITFFGIKGGVGRSTALVNWAWHLAEQGKTVLIFDLDLESPGVSSSLLPVDNLPDFGIVDWFVEDGVGQANAVAEEMMGTSPLAQHSSGKILVVPAYGSKTGDYLPKLARCYAELGGNEPMSWAERLQKLVESMEAKIQPDVVIFDSRAGLHDIAAVTVTRMDADTLLFAINTPQTWAGYGMLFKHWNKHPQVDLFRNRLQIVAGMVPETGRAAYLQSCQENAWDLFVEYLYDEANSDELDAFNFDKDDDSAPHAPIPVYWQRGLQEFDPINNGLDVRLANDAYGLLMEQADQILAASCLREHE
jgi:Mrp family chromosome partitioning ATPase